MSKNPTLKYCNLPNNLRIAFQSKPEVDFFYRDIFVKQIYLRNGIFLRDGDYVFDVGSNIGLFSIFVHQVRKDITVYAFEPAPPLFAAVQANMAAHGVKAKTYNCGLSGQNGTAAFTFYPESSGMSSFYASEHEEREALRSIMLNQLRQGVTGMQEIMPYADDLLNHRLQNKQFTCQLRTLSDVISKEHVERIDLLKIDVQKSEWDVLAGIQVDDWPRIKQVVIEVHDLEHRLQRIIELLKIHRYNTLIEQDSSYEGSNLYNVYASRYPIDGA